ncbi:MAG: Slp family lipoprotein [Gammaproteobacteria bacterium]|nr:Slp family lipoprotein [Gammaproteobacteria bacterium]
MDRLGIVLLSAVLLPACASQIPEQTSSVPSRNSPTEADAHARAQRFNGEHVRWGGTIAAVEKRESQTWIEVDRCHLSNNGMPAKSHREGQFFARLEGNVDPAIYARGRYLTVVGDLENENSGAIDGYAYHQPVVNVEMHHLWASLPEGHNGVGAKYGAYSRMPYPYGPMFFSLFY